MPVHPTAVVDPQAVVDPSAVIGPYVVVEGPVVVEAGCRIGPYVMLCGSTVVGRNCRVHAHASIGDVPQDRAFQGGETFCRIGEDTVIREGVTVHRGTAPGSTTVVGERCLLMTNSHVGHNCHVGDDVTLVSGALLGGHVEVGARTIISGNCAVHQFVRIGELVMVSGLAKVVQDVPPFFMTDRDAHVVGVNSVGLRRAGYSEAERAEAKAAYRILYRSPAGGAAALDLLRAEMRTEVGRRIVEFFARAGSRGLAKGRERRRTAA
jgi:UDP-N-acetylglucosamine acyltransferase